MSLFKTALALRTMKTKGRRLGAALLAGGAIVAALLLVSGDERADPETPPGLPGMPPPFLGVAVLGDRSATGDPTPTSDFTQDGVPTAVADAVPSPSGLQGTRQADGSVVFTWDNPAPQKGDRYVWAVLEATGEPERALIDTAMVTVPADQATAAEVCIEVAIVRADRSMSAEPSQGCAS